MSEAIKSVILSDILLISDLEELQQIRAACTVRINEIVPSDQLAAAILDSNPKLANEPDIDTPALVRDYNQGLQESPSPAAPWIDSATKAILIVCGVLLALVMLRNLFPSWPIWKPEPKYEPRGLMQVLTREQSTAEQVADYKERYAAAWAEREAQKEKQKDFWTHVAIMFATACLLLMVGHEIGLRLGWWR